MDFSEVTLQYNYTDRHTPLWHPFLNYSSDFVKLFQGYGLYTVGDVGFLSNDQVCVCVCVCAIGDGRPCTGMTGCISTSHGRSTLKQPGELIDVCVTRWCSRWVLVVVFESLRSRSSCRMA